MERIDGFESFNDLKERSGNALTASEPRLEPVFEEYEYNYYSFIMSDLFM